MREQVCIALLLIIGLSACAHQGANRSAQASSTSVPFSAQPAEASAAPATSSAPATSVPSGGVSPLPPTASQPAPMGGGGAVKPSAPKPVALKPASAKPPRAPTSTPAAVPAAAATPLPASSPPKPQLDLKAIEQRLRDTSAIGVFTKLSIKNQVDDLLKAFRGYHAGQTPPTLDDLHQRYDGLLLKVVTLVQNDDSTLASSISASRNAIWEKLSNRESFQAI